MRFIQTFQLYDFLDTLVSLLTAFVFGTMIGAERQYRQRSAGLRTNVLVAVGAAAFVDLANHLTGSDGSVRVIAYVVSGIGFLGAGVIMKDGTNVTGLNTAATLWASAAVGCCAGADMVAQAALLTVFVLGGNTLLRPLVNAIDRIPIDEQSSEASYDVLVTTDSNSGAGDQRDHPVRGEQRNRGHAGQPLDRTWRTRRCRCQSGRHARCSSRQLEYPHARIASRNPGPAPGQILPGSASAPQGEGLISRA
jgi:putative Mg2+ transporter-C (MgtC) family protein